MIEIAARGRFAHRELKVAVELVAEEYAAQVAGQAPGIILRATQVDVVESLRAFLPEERIFQFAFAVLRAEKETEGVLGIHRHAAEPAANSHAAIDLKALRSVRINQFQRAGALRLLAVLPCIGINTAISLEEIVEIHDE